MEKYCITHTGGLNRFINEHCDIPSTFDVGSKKNLTYQDILDYNGYKYILFYDYHLEIFK